MLYKNMIIDFLKRIKTHNILSMSAKTAYYLILSFFPLVLIILSAFSQTNTDMFKYIVPPFVIKILDDIMEITPDIKVAAISSVVVLWSASTAIWALMDGIHLAYTGEMHKKLKNGRVRAVIFTAILIVMALVCVSLTILNQIDLGFYLPLPAWLSYSFFKFFHIASVIISIFLFIILLYAMTPCDKIKMKKIFIGAAMTSIIWIFATWSFEIYMNMFNNFSVIYGGVGAFLGLSLWLYVVTLVLFLGAELNAFLTEREF